MNVYKTSDIRNVVFLGHGGAGKTTLAEAVAYATGVVPEKDGLRTAILFLTMIRRR